MSINVPKKYNKSVTGKIIITCLLACGAIFISLYISRVTSSRILSTVDRLSKPNAKMQLVNGLFRDVVKLDQIQRNQALRTQPVQYTLFLNESHHLQIMLDSLRAMSLQNRTEVLRIDSMKRILNDRDNLFIHYIKLHDDLVSNDTLANQVRNISQLIEKTRLNIDNNLVTTSRATKTIIDTLVPEEDRQQTLWSRIFSKRKPQIKQVQKKVEEELKVRVDTMALGKSGDSLAELGKAISKVEINRIVHRNLLVKRRVELNRTGDILIDQLMSVLNDLEADELLHAAQQNTTANHLVNNSIVNISIVLVIFILSTTVLIFFIFTDISNSNQYRKELILAKEQAEEAGAVKQRFLANMSHELRTPLQTIIGISEQIRTTGQPRRQDMENIYQSSLHLLQIVNEVLDYSRIISGKYVLEQKTFNMYRLVDEVKEMIQVQLALKELALHYEINISNEHNYRGDPFRLKQVLLNLLGNAVKFTDEGSVSLLVSETETADNGSMITFIVSDTGVGITPEDMAVIFNQFEQGGNVYKKQGTGLGLSIVKALMDIQGGTIEVDSTPNKGTTFTIAIPYERSNEMIAEPATAPTSVDSYSGYVWIVDDDLFILQLCDSILNKYKVPHTCFSSAREALNTPFPPSLGVVFLDIRMAEMDGITLCGKLRERDTQQPEYIALTAQAMPDERDAILKRGFDGLVMKPFLEQDFMSVVNQYTVKLLPAMQVALDLSAIHKMAAGDEEMIDMVLQSFLSETEKDVVAAKQSMQNNDADALAEALHKLAGRCGQVGAMTLSHDLRTMEIALRNGKNTGEVKGKLEALYLDIAAVTDAVKALCKKGNVPT